MGDVPPEVAWEHILGLVFQAFEYQCDASYALLHEMNMNEDLRTMLAIHDQEDLILYLSRMNPVEGVNEFVYINENVAFGNILSHQPLEVLKGVLRIFTESNRWASRKC